MRPIDAMPSSDRGLAPGRAVLGAGLLGALFAGVFFGLLHASDPVLADPDGYFHIRFASMGPAVWMARDLPWMRYTIFDGGHWVDHQLIFHALQWPFTKVWALATAAKVSAAALAALAVGTFTALLARRGVRHAWIWALVLLGSSWMFDFRMLMPRAQSLSLALLLLGLGLAWEGRRLGIIVIGFVFAWTYHVGLLLVPLALIAGLSRPESAGERLRPAIYAALGLGLGFALHPQSPDTFAFLWLHTVVKVLNQSGLVVGREWAPASPRTWFSATWPVLVLLGGLAWRARRSDSRAALAIAAGGAGLSLLASKWLEYAVPFGVLAGALCWRDLRATAGAPPLGRLAPLVGLGIAGLVGWQFTFVRDGVAGLSRRPEQLERIAAALPPSDCRVAHTSWSDFATIFYLAPQCRLIDGLDPHFLAVGDPDRATLLRRLAAGEVAGVATAVGAELASNYLLVDTEALGARAEADPGMALVVRDGAYSLWAVRP